MSKERFLVIGGSGFIGRHFYEYLEGHGHSVVGTYFSNHIGNQLQWNIDLTVYSQIDSLLKLGFFDKVIMAAAKTYGVGISASSPEDMVRENIIMNVNVLDACLRHKVKKVLYISSSTVYQDSLEVMQEDDLDLNKDPYYLYQGVGWVKRYTEQLCKFYHTRGLNTVVVRPTNIYGKYDSYKEVASHFIPAIVKRAVDKQDPFKVWGTGRAMKDYIHVKDFVRDALDLLYSYDKPDPVNINSGRVYSVKEAVEIILKKCNHEVVPEYGENQLDSPSVRILSKKKFNSILGVRNYLDLYEGLNDVIEWIREDSKRAR